jgi:hypothetical protein
MAKLKGVIFGVENVLIKPGDTAPHAATLAETGRLVRFLRSRGVESVVMTNRGWTASEKEGKNPRPLQDAIQAHWGVELSWFQCGKDGVPAKQTADSIQHVRVQKGWQPNETLFIGNTDVDMQASVNGRILLLNAQWYERTMEYGFGCDSPKEVARFIDTFCFRDHFWYFKIEDGPIQVYSLAPLSTFYDEMKYYSEDFLRNIKNGFAQDEEFWAKFLSTSMYFSGVSEPVDYVTAYPKHAAGQYHAVLLKPMTTFAKCFRKSYIPDLIYRHTTALKSQYNRTAVTHTTQLDSIHLRQLPHRIVKGEMRQYANFPVKAGSTVLVIDDVCTKGMSFEAARCYLNGIGARVISVSFLKALKHDYEALRGVTLPFGVFGHNKVTALNRGKTYPWLDYVVDREAPNELRERLKRYQGWDWPAGV